MTQDEIADELERAGHTVSEGRVRLPDAIEATWPKPLGVVYTTKVPVTPGKPGSAPDQANPRMAEPVDRG